MSAQDPHETAIRLIAAALPLTAARILRSRILAGRRVFTRGGILAGRCILARHRRTRARRAERCVEPILAGRGWQER